MSEKTRRHYTENQLITSDICCFGISFITVPPIQQSLSLLIDNIKYHPEKIRKQQIVLDYMVPAITSD